MTPFTSYLDNRVNKNMNNLYHTDYCNKDWTYDNDAALSRYSTEFPRVFSERESKPYGSENPESVDLTNEHPWMQTYSKGKWYFDSVPLSDHQDACTVPPIASPLRCALPKWMGSRQEYRYKLWRNIFIRL